MLKLRYMRRTVSGLTALKRAWASSASMLSPGPQTNDSQLTTSYPHLSPVTVQSTHSFSRLTNLLDTMGQPSRKTLHPSRKHLEGEAPMSRSIPAPHVLHHFLQTKSSPFTPHHAAPPRQTTPIACMRPTGLRSHWSNDG